MNASGGVRRFELPAGRSVAPLTGPDTGVHRLVARPSVASTATVIDTPDRRLLQWGIELGRVLETGHWQLRAHGWQPTLPAEQKSSDDDEIPADFAMLLAPLRRGGLLGPVLEVDAVRQPFQLIDAAQGIVGLLTEERVTLTGRPDERVEYRQVTLRVDALTDAQVDAVRAALAAAGAVEVGSFAPLAARLGILRDPGRPNLAPQLPIETFVKRQFTARWRTLLQADIALRRDPAIGDEGVRAAVADLHHEVSALSPLLSSGWAESTLTLIDAALADRSRSLINTERYPRILSTLADAADHPAMGAVAGRLTGPVLAQELESRVQVLIDQCRVLDSVSSDAHWARAVRTLRRVEALTALSARVLGKPAKRLRKRLVDLADALSGTVRPEITVSSGSLHGLSAAEIFDAGRSYERTLMSVEYARIQFIEEWPYLFQRLRGRVIRPAPIRVVAG